MININIKNISLVASTKRKKILILFLYDLNLSSVIVINAAVHGWFL